MEQFEFRLDISRDGDIVAPTEIIYKGDCKTKLYNITGTTWKYGWSIESRVFKEMYVDTLYWSPGKLWKPNVTIQSFEFTEGILPFNNMTQFPIFGTATQSFKSNFKKLETAQENTRKAKTVTKVKMDKDDPHFASLMAAYIISHNGGVSLEHLRENPKVPIMITSIARFYVYSHVKRFLRDPTKMSRFINKDDLIVVQKNIPTQKQWETKMHYGKQIISYWLAKQPNKADIRYDRYVHGRVLS